MEGIFALYKNLGSDELLLDVRTPEEFQEGHVPGSKNIPYDQVAAHIEELKKYSKIYIHCQLGGRAGRAAMELYHLGLRNLVCAADSGMKAWMLNGFPIEK